MVSHPFDVLVVFLLSSVASLDSSEAAIVSESFPQSSRLVVFFLSIFGGKSVISLMV